VGTGLGMAGVPRLTSGSLVGQEQVLGPGHLNEPSQPGRRVSDPERHLVNENHSPRHRTVDTGVSLGGLGTRARSNNSTRSPASPHMAFSGSRSGYPARGSEKKREAAMIKHHPVVWLKGRATTGLKDMPGNAAWVARQARRSSSTALGRATDAMSDAGSSVGEAITQAGRSVVDAVPGVGSDDDSVETRLRDARRASDEAREAEERALALAQEAKQAADGAKRITRAARERAKEAERDAKAQAGERVDQVRAEADGQVVAVRRDGDERVREARREADERVKQARRSADERVAQERQRAGQDADKAIAATRATADADAQQAQQEAQQASERAEQAVGEATQALTQARQLADEASQAALAAAAEAGREAERLAVEAGQVASYTTGDGRGTATARSRSSHSRSPRRRSAGGPAAKATPAARLELQSKTELLRRAGALDVEGRATMSKAQLAQAIKKAPTNSG
jgi:colicin import membrane protein